MAKNIPKTAYENEQIKRNFLQQLEGGRGFAETSIQVHADAIAQWQTFTEKDDFSNFNKTKAREFVKWLSTRPAKTKTGKIALVTQSNYLRHVKKFFEWLSEQPGYRSKILKSEVNFLRLSKKDASIARQGTTKQMPTFEQVQKLIQSIEVKNELDQRDRALISLIFITGARISAVATLRMKNFNWQEEIIDQNPADKVKTKASKRIPCTFFPIGWDDPKRYFMEWYAYLESKGFLPDDPIFPATFGGFAAEKNNHSKDLLSRNCWNTSSPAREIFKKRFLDAGLPYFHPHSFRHLIVGTLSKNRRLTEEQRKAISLNLGHEDVVTTFGSYGYSNMTSEEAITVVKNLGNPGDDASTSITEEDAVFLERIARKGRS